MAFLLLIDYPFTSVSVLMFVWSLINNATFRFVLFPLITVWLAIASAMTAVSTVPAVSEQVHSDKKHKY
jgi:hypothetical protein